MISSFSLVVIIIVLALVFDFLNGANDRANAIGTTTATKALSPITALIVASIFNFLGALASTKVAETIGKGIVPSKYINLTILAAGVSGAIVWVLICTKSGIPISVSHSLVGGILGAGLIAGGTKIISWNILTNKVLLAIIFGPVAGFLAGAFFLTLFSWIVYLFFKRVSSAKIKNFFRKGQILTTPFMAFTHGMNDAQNAMGIITITLLTGGFINQFSVPLWVKLGCGLSMSLGTFFMGWRVMRTLGWKLTKVEAREGFSAELGAGTVIGFHSLLGIPLSTTHVVCSSVIGGTILENWRRIKQMVAWRMIMAWMITLPCSGLMAVLIYLLLNLIV